MTVEQLKETLSAEYATTGTYDQREVTCGYSCDLLSWVMAHGEAGMAWITVQTHLNVIAVAVLMEFSCIILPEDIQMEESSLIKAQSEGMPVLKSSKTAYQLSGEMAMAGIPASQR